MSIILKEFAALTQPSLDALVGAFSKLGKLYRYGGPQRVYQIAGENKKGIIFAINDSLMAIGFGWTSSPSEVSSVYYWKDFQFGAPDYAVDLPADSDVNELAPKIIKMIRAHTMGQVPVKLSEAVLSERDPLPGAAQTPATGNLPPTGRLAPPAPPASANAQPTPVGSYGGQVFLTGRNASSSYFTIPGFDQLNAQFTHMMDKGLAQTGQATMEEQYEELAEEIEGLASGKAQFKKSLLVTGAPSSGKSFNVIKVLDKLGVPYVLKSGSTGVPGLYRSLLEQINGLVVYDDCDEVIEDKDGVNILKGALNTADVREISRDKANYLNVGVLGANERARYAAAVSALLRAQQTDGDIRVIEVTLHRLKLLPRILQNFNKEKQKDGHEGKGFVSTAGTREDVICDYAKLHLPNMFDFQGKVIFISNLEAKDWPAAITNRAVVVNMTFQSGEMLDFIEKICEKIKTPGLSLEEKLETLHYLRELWESGNLKKAVNFRTAQLAWDTRLTPNWKRKIARW